VIRAITPTLLVTAIAPRIGKNIYHTTVFSNYLKKYKSYSAEIL